LNDRRAGGSYLRQSGTPELGRWLDRSLGYQVAPLKQAQRRSKFGCLGWRAPHKGARVFLAGRAGELGDRIAEMQPAQEDDTARSVPALLTGNSGTKLLSSGRSS